MQANYITEYYIKNFRLTANKPKHKSNKNFNTALINNTLRYKFNRLTWNKKLSSDNIMYGSMRRDIVVNNY